MYQIRPVRNTKDRQKAPSVTLTWIRNYSLDECWSKFWSSWLVYFETIWRNTISIQSHFLAITIFETLSRWTHVIGWYGMSHFCFSPAPCPIYLAHVQSIWPMSSLSGPSPVYSVVGSCVSLLARLSPLCFSCPHKYLVWLINCPGRVRVSVSRQHPLLVVDRNWKRLAVQRFSNLLVWLKKKKIPQIKDHKQAHQLAKLASPTRSRVSVLVDIVWRWAALLG